MADLQATHMPALAQALVASFDRQSVVLDFTVRSLAIVDAYLINLRPLLQQAAAADAAAGEREFDENCQRIAGYVGEVIRRQSGGAWIDGPRMPQLRLGEPVVQPLNAVAHLLAAGQATLDTTTVRSLVDYCQAALQVQHAWTERVVAGAYGSLPALKRAMAAEIELGAWLALQCQLAVQTASLKWATVLDFSAASLDALEPILEALHQAGRAATPGTGPSPEQLDAAIKVWGVYVGEVFRRHYGGRWHLEDGALVLAMDKARAAPLSKVRKRIVDGPADNVAYYFKATAAVLAGSLS
jgi:hypothetical protein